jgi:hypothetical protein
MDESAKIETLSDYLRLTWTGNPNGLRAKIDDIAKQGGALNSVVITGDAFESGAHHGQLVFEPLAFLRAAMDVLRELDPTLVPEPAPRGALVDYRPSIVGT